jgi:hypothetical protein
MRLTLTIPALLSAPSQPCDSEARKEQVGVLEPVAARSTGLGPFADLQPARGCDQWGHVFIRVARHEPGKQCLKAKGVEMKTALKVWRIAVG